MGVECRGVSEVMAGKETGADLPDVVLAPWRACSRLGEMQQGL